jgi:hypothetical protein
MQALADSGRSLLRSLSRPVAVSAFLALVFSMTGCPRRSVFGASANCCARFLLHSSQVLKKVASDVKESKKPNKDEMAKVAAEKVVFRLSSCARLTLSAPDRPKSSKWRAGRFWRKSTKPVSFIKRSPACFDGVVCR